MTPREATEKLAHKYVADPSRHGELWNRHIPILISLCIEEYLRVERENERIAKATQSAGR